MLPSDAPPPRRCVIEKLPGETEYGYTLHAEKNLGKFVGLVYAGSPAERGGLLPGDRIFAVNGHSIIGENHKEIVERIKAQPERCEMLVLSEDGVKWYQDQNIQITLDVLEQALENKNRAVLAEEGLDSREVGCAEGQNCQRLAARSRDEVLEKEV